MVLACPDCTGTTALHEPGCRQRSVNDVAPVCKPVPVEWLEQLLRKAGECADEIEAEVNARYPSRGEQPVAARRYKRDMALVTEMRDAIALVRGA